MNSPSATQLLPVTSVPPTLLCCPTPFKLGALSSVVTVAITVIAAHLAHVRLLLVRGAVHPAHSCSAAAPIPAAFHHSHMGGIKLHRCHSLTGVQIIPLGATMTAAALQLDNSCTRGYLSSVKSES
jgi:hypothetical protein